LLTVVADGVASETLRMRAVFLFAFEKGFF